MRRIADRKLAELLVQLRYTPGPKRLDQIRAAEELASCIDPQKDYPWEFIHFRIIGFKPARHVDPYLISGRQLLQDLKVFITRLSTIACPRIAQIPDQVYSIGQVAEMLRVSQRTIHRWRELGLVARRFIFADNKKRLGIRQEVLDRFVQCNPDLVCRASRFSRLTGQQRKEIVDLATRLSWATEGSFSQLIAQVAQQTGRAKETIRYTLLRYLKSHPEHQLARKALSVHLAKATHQVLELYRQGTPVKVLMDRFARSRSSIYRIINQRRASMLLARRISYVPSPEFSDPAAIQQILADQIELPVFQQDLEQLPSRISNTQLLPEYLRILKQAPTVGGQLEMRLFRRYNCLKFLASQLRAQIRLSCPRGRLLDQIESYLAQAEAIEHVLVLANLRLVVSIASRHAQDPGQFADLVSKGNLALVTAIQEFDYTKGIRFGKQAALSIAKEYAKASGRDIELTRKRAASIASFQIQIRQATDIGAIEQARQSLMQVVQRELDDRQQYIITNHFGLTDSGIRRKRKTLQQIGQELNLSKERVRQIELEALQRLRRSLTQQQFELLTK